MNRRHRLVVLIALVALPLQAAATDLILPVFAINAGLPDGGRWSSEIYLVNPSDDSVQVSLAGLLPGRINRPTPCGQFMSQTRVVPPRSAVVWTASGLATDLGCADEVLGALMLRADGPVRVTGRMVRHPEVGDSAPMGLLSGSGQQINALPVNRLPGPTTILLPALLWHRNPCGPASYSTVVGFANPGSEPVIATLYLPEEGARAIKVDGRPVALPHQVVVAPDSWKQLNVAPIDQPDGICLEPESFDLELAIDGPLAVYGSVLDRSSMDARTVEPVDIERH